MSDLQMWSLIVGTLAPLVIAVIQQPRWPVAFRSVVAVTLCVLLGLGTTYFNGGLDGRPAVSSILVVIVAALATYQSFWRPTGIVPAVEAATSPHTAVRGDV